MTISVDTVDPRTPARTPHQHTTSEITQAPVEPSPSSESLVDCPACGLPAEVESRDMVAGTSGPEVHVQLRCPLGRHWFVMTEEAL
jgi:hypothetical protein